MEQLEEDIVVDGVLYKAGRIRNFDPRQLEGAKQISHNGRLWGFYTKAEAEAFIKGFRFAVTETGITVFDILEVEGGFNVLMDEITA